MKIDIPALKRLAEKATPGPWYHCQPFMTLPKTRTVHGPVPAWRVDFVSTRSAPAHTKTVIPMAQDGPGVSSNDMAFIAAANPATVLALIERVEQAELVAEAKSRAADRWCPCPDCRDKVQKGDCQRCRRQGAERKLAAAEAENKRLREALIKESTMPNYGRPGCWCGVCDGDGPTNDPASIVHKPTCVLAVQP
jgi:hypothetical protein